MAAYTSRHDVVLVLVEHLTARFVEMSGNELPHGWRFPITHLNPFEIIHPSCPVHDIQHVVQAAFIYALQRIILRP